MGAMNGKRPTAIKSTMKHVKTTFSTDTFAGAIISLVQYLVPLRYTAYGIRIPCHPVINAESLQMS
jgi:hypothetical protein